MLAADLMGQAADPSLGDTLLGQPGGPTGSISGSVFAASSAANCDSHAASASMAEVRVQLLDETGTVIAESSTDANGAYRFADLLPGQYAVRQIAQYALGEGDSLEGVSYVGDSGGIAIDSNLVGEIVVQAGETLGGYDFCESTGALESTAQFLPFLTLSLPTSPARLSEIVAAEPAVEPPNKGVHLAPTLLNVSRPAEVYGGSGRVLKTSENIKAWEESPLDGYFSTASFLELATAELPASDAFESILGESLLSSTEENAEEKSDEPFVEGPFADAPFANGSLANSIEWWEDEAQLKLEHEPLTGDEKVIKEAIDLAVLLH